MHSSLSYLLQVFFQFQLMLGCFYFLIILLPSIDQNVSAFFNLKKDKGFFIYLLCSWSLFVFKIAFLSIDTTSDGFSKCYIENRKGQNPEIEKAKQPGVKQVSLLENSANANPLHSSQHKLNYVCYDCNKVFGSHLKLTLHMYVKSHGAQRKNTSSVRNRKGNPQKSKYNQFLEGKVLTEESKQDSDNPKVDLNEEFHEESCTEHSSEFHL